MNAYMLYYATGVIMIPVLLFSFYCQIKVKRAFRRYSSVHAMCGMTGAQAAARLLQLNGITDVQIRQIGGTLTDYFFHFLKGLIIFKNNRFHSLFMIRIIK